MRKVLTFALAVILVMAMTVPAFAASNPSLPSATAGYQLPEVVGELPGDVKLYSVYDAGQLKANQQDAFAEAQGKLADAADEMTVKYFFYVTGATTPQKVELNIADAQEVIVKRYTVASGTWEDVTSELDAGVLSFDIQSGSIAVFTK